MLNEFEGFFAAERAELNGAGAVVLLKFANELRGPGIRNSFASGEDEGHAFDGVST